MSHPSDVWYVRLPDGRVLRAPSTVAVRHHVTAGRIPRDSRVRRSQDDEWAPLEWTEEFADLVPLLEARGRESAGAHNAETATASLPRPVSIASRLDPLQLQTVGVRGSVEELLAALDST